MILVDDRLRVCDLSSGAPHRPTVSDSSPLHSSSPSRSLPISGLVVDSDGYTLPQEPSEILTPVINRLMSPQASPKVPSNFEWHTTTANRRTRVDTHENYDLGHFIQWDRYRQSSDTLPSIDRSNSIRSHASLKRTDFTSKTELNQQRKKKGFIFHRGFFKRRSSYKRLRTSAKNTRNRAELNAVLTYADLQSFDPVDIISSKKVVIYRPNNITRRYPGISAAFEVPVPHYVRSKLPKRRTTIPRNSQIRRSNTCPSSLRSRRRRQNAPESGAIHDLWREYLSLVIAQRIQLRLSLAQTDLAPGNNDISIGNLRHATSTKSSLRSVDTRLSSLRKCS